MESLSCRRRAKAGRGGGAAVRHRAPGGPAPTEQPFAGSSERATTVRLGTVIVQNNPVERKNEDWHDDYGISPIRVTVSRGATVTWTDIQNYLKKGSVLYNSSGTDLLGNTYSGGSFSVDSLPKLSTTSFGKLSDVAPSDFWSPFYP